MKVRDLLDLYEGNENIIVTMYDDDDPSEVFYEGPISDVENDSRDYTGGGPVECEILGWVTTGDGDLELYVDTHEEEW